MIMRRAWSFPLLLVVAASFLLSTIQAESADLYAVQCAKVCRYITVVFVWVVLEL